MMGVYEGVERSIYCCTARTAYLLRQNVSHGDEGDLSIETCLSGHVPFSGNAPPTAPEHPGAAVASQTLPQKTSSRSED